VDQGDPLDLFISAGFGQAFAAAPKVLGDLFESIAGAVFVDSGGDIDVLWKVGKTLISSYASQGHIAGVICPVCLAKRRHYPNFGPRLTGTKARARHPKKQILRERGSLNLGVQVLCDRAPKRDFLEFAELRHLSDLSPTTSDIYCGRTARHYAKIRVPFPPV
jgi:hypothetical protein